MAEGIKPLSGLDIEEREYYVQAGFTQEFMEKVDRFFSKEGAEQFQYYRDELFREAATLFKQRVQAEIEAGNLRSYKNLIFSVGFSPEPIAMVIHAFEPERVYFIFTPETNDKLDRIAELVPLPLSRIRTIPVEGNSAEEIYQHIKDITEDQYLKNRLHETAIDFTGGKKSMGSILSLAGFIPGMDVLYVDYDKYNPKRRKPYPGTEKLIRITNPLVVFGDFEAAKGIERFNRFDYAGAHYIFEELRMKVRYWDRKFDVLSCLAKALNQYDNFNFKEAYDQLLDLDNQMDNWNTMLEKREIIRHHLALLETIKDTQAVIDTERVFGLAQKPEAVWHLIGNLLQCAHRREEQGRMDMAALLYYRTLELIIQRRLALLHIDTTRVELQHLISPVDEKPLPDYIKKKSFSSISQLADEVSKVGSTLHGRGYRSPFNKEKTAITQNLTLMPGLIFLVAAGDPAFQQCDLRKIKRGIDTRNLSILAHGLKILQSEQLRDFSKTVREVLDAVWKEEKVLMNVEESFEEFERKFEFPLLH